MAGVNSVPEAAHDAAHRKSTDRVRPGSEKFDGTGSGASPVSVRRARPAVTGSHLQKAIGGPFPGRAGDAAMKSERIKKMPI